MRPLDIEPTDDLDLVACRALWCAVIAEHWNLAVLPAPYEVHSAIAGARAWFGCPDYHRICEMAGVDSDDVLSAYRAARQPGAAYRVGVLGQHSPYGRHKMGRTQ